MSDVRAVALLAALACFGIVLFAPGIFNDGDTYWHIAAGRWMLDNHAVLRIDPFSFTFAGKPWQTHEWLAQIVIALAYVGLGWNGVALLFATVFALTAGLLGKHLSEKLSGPTLGVTVILSLSLMAGGLLARPHILALLPLEIWTAGLLFARDKGRAPGQSAWRFYVRAFFNPDLCLRSGIGNPLRRQNGSPLAIVRLFIHRRGNGDAFRGRDVTLSVQADGHAGAVQDQRMAASQDHALRSLDAVGRNDVVRSAVARGKNSTASAVPLTRPFLYDTRSNAPSIAVGHGRASAVGGPIGKGPEQRAKAWIAFAFDPLAAMVMLAGIRILWPIKTLDSAMTPAAALVHVPSALARAPVLNEYGFGGYLIFKDLRPFIDGRAELYGQDFLKLYDRLSGMPNDAPLKATLA